MLVHFLLQPPPSQERQEAGGPVLAEQEDSALGNTPKTPAGECSSPSSPSSVCENLYQSRCWCATAGARLHVRIISQQLARKWWPRPPRNHACGNVLPWWEKLYQRLHSTAEKPPARLPLPSVLFLKFPFLFICQIVIQSHPEELSQSQHQHV